MHEIKYKKKVHAGFDPETWFEVHNFQALNNTWTIQKKIEKETDVTSLKLEWYEKRIFDIWNLHGAEFGRVLEIGSLWGRFCFYLIQHNKVERLIGTDASSIIAQHANDLSKYFGFYPKLQFGVALAEDLQFENNSFDLIFVFETLEHVGDLERSLLEIKRVLKEKGTFIFSIPLHSLADGGYHTQKHGFTFWRNLLEKHFTVVEFLLVRRKKSYFVFGKVKKDGVI